MVVVVCWMVVVVCWMVVVVCWMLAVVFRLTWAGQAGWCGSCSAAAAG